MTARGQLMRFALLQVAKGERINSSGVTQSRALQAQHVKASSTVAPCKSRAREHPWRPSCRVAASSRSFCSGPEGRIPPYYPSTSLLAAQEQGSLLGSFLEDEAEGERNWPLDNHIPHPFLQGKPSSQRF